MKRFEYLVVFVSDDRVIRSNGHWQGEVAEGEAGAEASCPSMFAWLEEAGAQGWELIALDPEAEGTAKLYLKRTHG